MTGYVQTYESIRPFQPEGLRVRTFKGFRPHCGQDKIGLWQLAFFKEQGLEPHHRFLDIGCNDLRWEILTLRYLDPDRYFSLDQFPSVLDHGVLSLDKSDCTKRLKFFFGGDFDLGVIGSGFDFF